MSCHKSKLRSSTVMPLFLSAGIAAGAALAVAPAGAKSGSEENPVAVSKGEAGLIRMAACGAKKACNPCSAKKN